MVQVNVKIADVKTIHTTGGNRLNQPMIEVTLEINKIGETDKYEIKFSEMLSNIADKTNQELLDMLEMLVGAYVRTAYKGQQSLDSETGEWKRAAQAIGKEYIIEI